METIVKFTGHWNELKTNHKQKCPKLNDLGLAYSIGIEGKLYVSLVGKLGKTPRRNNLLN